MTDPPSPRCHKKKLKLIITESKQELDACGERCLDRNEIIALELDFHHILLTARIELLHKHSGRGREGLGHEGQR
jgi:hypothetical protein